VKLTALSILRTVCGLTAAAALISAWFWREAARAEQVQLQHLDHIRALAHTVDAAQQRMPDWALNSRPAGTLAPLVSATLAAAGLPPSTLGSLSADSETGAGPRTGVQVRRRRAVLTLSGLTLPQLGGFLSQWRERQPTWTVSQIDIAPDLTPKVKDQLNAAGGDMPLRAVIAVETLWLERGGVR